MIKGLCLVILFLVLVIFCMAIIMKFMSSENKRLKNYKEMYFNEKKKQKLHTGDDVDNFNNSISVLSQLSKN